MSVAGVYPCQVPIQGSTTPAFAVVGQVSNLSVTHNSPETLVRRWPETLTASDAEGVAQQSRGSRRQERTPGLRVARAGTLKAFDSLLPRFALPPVQM
ncbi:MAG: hypothetical protein DWQ34_10870 [Planctomycetota bacterium]|nr:MAG: hypothetical protein DWQ34_10870 [Planctomycetota bacterium]REK20783.1 MAG: hypothetical protein DWQ41_24390 [Planctomycetota bacterium]REK38034.1 MAG: hypothetical protein DWQ45_05160 [Planctomycetota bacterium]